MPDRAAPPPPPDPFAQVKAQFGPENLEAILGTYRAFADKVDYRALVSWTMKQPIEDLLQPLFLAALVVITKELRLGELTKRLDEPFDGGETEWAVRMDGPHRTRIIPMFNEADAREYASGTSDGGYSYTVMRRHLTAWTEVAP